jgi:hypothetical protein
MIRLVLLVTGIVMICAGVVNEIVARRKRAAADPLGRDRQNPA